MYVAIPCDVSTGYADIWNSLTKPCGLLDSLVRKTSVIHYNIFLYTETLNRRWKNSHVISTSEYVKSIFDEGYSKFMNFLGLTMY